MQMLCQLEVNDEEAMDDMEDFFIEQEACDHVRRYAASLTRGCWSNREELDRRVAAASKHWSVDRISPVERNIIRVAVAEMLGSAGATGSLLPVRFVERDAPDTGGPAARGTPAVPPKVAINEAIEIGKEYGGADTPRFINGVLNGVYQHICEETGNGVA